MSKTSRACLTRVASLFRRRAFNIDSLTVGRTEKPEVSRMTITVDADQDQARRIEASLYKLVNILLVEDITDEPAITRDLAMIKVAAQHDQRSHVLQLVNVFRARVVDVAPESLDHRNHRRRREDRSPAGSAAPLWSAGNGAHRHRGHAPGHKSSTAPRRRKNWTKSRPKRATTKASPYRRRPLIAHPAMRRLEVWAFWPALLWAGCPRRTTEIPSLCHRHRGRDFPHAEYLPYTVRKGGLPAPKP